MESSINKDRFFNFETSHYDFIMENKHIVSPDDPHPSAEGHSQWAKHLTDFIDANDLRTIQ
jgi:lysophospholipase L1-like esterase